MHKLVFSFLVMIASAAAFADSKSPVLSFDEMDIDGDGYLSNVEANARPDLTEAWRRIDADSNNRLDISEFSAFEAKERFSPPEESEEPEPGAAPLGAQ